LHAVARRRSLSINVLALLILILGCAECANAYITAPTLVGTNPVAIKISAGVCDGIFADPPLITQSGSNIKIVVPTDKVTDLAFCTYPEATATFVVGTFGPGNYSLEVDRTFIGHDGPEAELLGVLEFTIAQLRPAPTLGAAAIVLLALLLVLATFAERSKRFASATVATRLLLRETAGTGNSVRRIR
jgi:hypothetical protein